MLSLLKLSVKSSTSRKGTISSNSSLSASQIPSLKGNPSRLCYFLSDSTQLAKKKDQQREGASTMLLTVNLVCGCKATENDCHLKLSSCHDVGCVENYCQVHHLGHHLYD